VPVQKIIEKPDGARNVESWDVHIERSYEREHILVPNGDGTYRIESYYNDSPSIVWLKMAVKFWDDESAREFEAKVRAMLPEVAW
jgi:hypothetical protein